MEHKDIASRRAAIHGRVKSRATQIGLKIAEVERMSSLGVGSLRNWIRPDKNVTPSLATLEKLAATLHTTVNWLIYGDAMVASFAEELPPNFAKTSSPEEDLPLADSAPSIRMPTLPDRRFVTMEDVPVYGTAGGSLARGSFLVEDDVIDEVSRPIGLRSNRHAYALYVEGSSMEPQFSPGDLIFINPNRPPRTGEVVVVRYRSIEDNRNVATLGVLEGRSELSITLRKHKPAGSTVEIRREGAEIHKVMSTNELFAL
ncbi:helix-turn-helix transcriptional regulator [Rhizobium sp. SGZ-381]|uniref:LexA family transcriptional regulator n=1 Tax=Rhizobium sp. SGZ-381 TaxID=3342800 RepID=UPI00366D4330